MTLKKLQNSDIKGVNFCVMQFASRFIHVSKQYQTKNRKKINKFRIVFAIAIVVSDCSTKWLNWFIKLLCKISLKHKKVKKLKT